MIAPIHLEFSGSTWPWIAVLVLTAATLAHTLNSRASKWLLALRLLAALVFAAALLNPALDLRRGVLKKPELLILIDNGHSMSAPAGKKFSRLEEALAWLEKNKARIQSVSDPRLMVLSDGARDISWSELGSLDASQAAFDPATSLSQAQSEIAAQTSLPKGVWFISDGVAQTQAPKEALSSFGVPVDLLGAGREPQGAGLFFTNAEPPDFAFLHQRLSIPFTLKAWGLSGRRVSVNLFSDLSGASGRQLEAQISFSPNSPFTTMDSSFSVTAQNPGSESFVLTAQAQDERGGLIRTERRIKVQVVRQKYRIMFLAGRPSPEYVFLREFLKSDPNREVVSFVILRNPDNIIPIPEDALSLIPFPEQEIFMQDISQFDLFILENFSPARFYLPPDYLASVRDYVAKGGALLIIGGENAFNFGGYQGTPLEDLLPAKLSASTPDFMPGLYHAKPLDFSHPLVNLYADPGKSEEAWSALADLDGYARLDSASPNATVVAVNPRQKAADGEALPIIAVKSYGRGKVMMITTDSTWRWRLGSARQLAVSDFYQRFWSRAVEYLSGSLDLSKVKFVPLPEPLPEQEPLEISLRIFDAQFRPAPNEDLAVSITWTKPDKSQEALKPQAAGPGLYRVSMTGLPAGPQKLDASVFFQGKPWDTDRLEFVWNPGATVQPMDEAWLEQAAQDSHGQYVNLAQADAGKLLAKLPKAEITAQTREQLHPFESPWFLALAGALFVLEIFWRRLKGHA